MTVEYRGTGITDVQPSVLTIKTKPGIGLKGGGGIFRNSIGFLETRLGFDEHGSFINPHLYQHGIIEWENGKSGEHPVSN